MSSTDRLSRPGAEGLPSGREASRAAPSGEAPPSSKPLWAGLAASLGAFACCGAALVLATLGVGGGLAAGLKPWPPSGPSSSSSRWPPSAGPGGGSTDEPRPAPPARPARPPCSASAGCFG